MPSTTQNQTEPRPRACEIPPGKAKNRPSGVYFDCHTFPAIFLVERLVRISHRASIRGHLGSGRKAEVSVTAMKLSLRA
jgi:hypothetical protein